MIDLTGEEEDEGDEKEKKDEDQDDVVMSCTEVNESANAGA